MSPELWIITAIVAILLGSFALWIIRTSKKKKRGEPYPGFIKSDVPMPDDVSPPKAETSSTSSPQPEGVSAGFKSVWAGGAYQPSEGDAPQSPPQGEAGKSAVTSFLKENSDLIEKILTGARDADRRRAKSVWPGGVDGLQHDGDDELLAFIQRNATEIGKLLSRPLPQSELLNLRADLDERINELEVRVENYADAEVKQRPTYEDFSMLEKDLVQRLQNLAHLTASMVAEVATEDSAVLSGINSDVRGIITTFRKFEGDLLLVKAQVAKHDKAAVDFWKDSTGNVIRIRDMSDNHLRNCVAGGFGTQKMRDKMADELERREKDLATARASERLKEDFPGRDEEVARALVNPTPREYDNDNDGITFKSFGSQKMAAAAKFTPGIRVSFKSTSATGLVKVLEGIVRGTKFGLVYVQVDGEPGRRAVDASRLTFLETDLFHHGQDVEAFAIGLGWLRGTVQNTHGACVTVLTKTGPIYAKHGNVRPYVAQDVPQSVRDMVRKAADKLGEKDSAEFPGPF